MNIETKLISFFSDAIHLRTPDMEEILFDDWAFCHYHKSNFGESKGSLEIAYSPGNPGLHVRKFKRNLKERYAYFIFTLDNQDTIVFTNIHRYATGIGSEALVKLENYWKELGNILQKPVFIEFSMCCQKSTSGWLLKNNYVQYNTGCYIKQIL